jgi:hypothetical protein
LLTRHILRDGEAVLLVLKPSLWYIVLTSVGFAAAVLILMIAAITLGEGHVHSMYYIEAAVFLIAGRVMWAVLQWMARLYILTDLRIVRLSGVFTVDIFDCPLRKVARTRRFATTREKLLGLGCVEIQPQDQSCTPGIWQTVRHPQAVHDQIVAAISRAQNCSLGDAA